MTDKSCPDHNEPLTRLHVRCPDSDLTCLLVHHKLVCLSCGRKQWEEHDRPATIGELTILKQRLDALAAILGIGAGWFEIEEEIVENCGQAHPTMDLICLGPDRRPRGHPRVVRRKVRLTPGALMPLPEGGRPLAYDPNGVLNLNLPPTAPEREQP